ncbi:hypothetical protein [Mucilaginibacter sp.]|uniref:hypothetical protein n=1 Tax=Mucilaginibacter sp. TaxID=1882438 RepID=UPI00326773BB
MLEQYYHIEKCTGISIFLQPDGGVDAALCSVTKNRNQLNIDQTKTGLTNIKELSKYIKQKEFVSLNIYGKGILIKRIEKVQEVEKNAFHTILPNAESKDFYIQNFISGEYSYVSAIRKTEADHLINQFNGQGFKVLAVSLGPFAVQNIIDQLNFYGEEFLFAGHKVSRNESGDWLTYSFNEINKSPYPIKLDVDVIDERAVLPYAQAFQLILADKLSPISAFVESLTEAYANTIRHRKFKAATYVILAVFFVALLANYILLSGLNSQNIQLVNQLALTSKSTEDIDSLSKKIAGKEALLKTLGWDGGINKSMLIDQLAAQSPAEIIWTEVSINPVDIQKTRLEKTLTFKNKRIHIIGNSQRIIPVNEWIARIKALQWVKNVQLERFVFSTEENTGQFDIEIDY